MPAIGWYCMLSATRTPVVCDVSIPSPQRIIIASLASFSISSVFLHSLRVCQSSPSWGAEGFGQFLGKPSAFQRRSREPKDMTSDVVSVASAIERTSRSSAESLVRVSSLFPGGAGDGGRPQSPVAALLFRCHDSASNRGRGVKHAEKL